MIKYEQEKLAVVITNDSDFRELLTPGLGELGYRVTVEEYPSGALSESLDKKSAPLIIIDLDSFIKADSELFRIIQEFFTRRHQTVILAYGNEDHQFEKVSAFKPDFFLIKPLNPQLLRIQLLAADKHRLELSELIATQKKVTSYGRELSLMEQQYEEAFSRANALTVTSEISRLELDQIFKTVAGCIILIDKDNNVIRANDAVSKLTGLMSSEIQGKKCFESSLCGCCHTSECPFSRIKGGETRVEIEVQKALSNGEIAYYVITATPLRTFGPEFMGIVTSLTDITERVKAERSLMETKEALRISEEKYRQLSIVDDLTGLFNKRHLNVQLEVEILRALRHGRPLSLLLMDIDNFKHINDTFGHSQGDQVLAGLAKMVMICKRKSDMAFRYGGEELVVILPETSIGESANVAERIRRSCASLTFPVNSSERIIVTLSIGATQYVSGEDQHDFVTRADQHMYCAKKDGKNRVVCDVI